MSNNTRIALDMLGEVIDFYNDDGATIEVALDEDIDSAIDVYNIALKSIQKRYNVFVKLVNEED